MKKVLSLLMVLALTAFVFSACSTQSTTSSDAESSKETVSEASSTEAPKAEETPAPTEPVTINIGGLKGPTSMGMV